MRVINDLADNALHKNLTLNDDRSLKTLGVSWSLRDDKICYSAHPINPTRTLTKRKILSEIAKFFDPLGLMGPVVFYAKQLMQKTWCCGVQWDESVPQSIHTEWSEFVRQLETMGRVTFDRRLLMKEYNDIQLHGFCDASNIGYGACIYVRSSGKNNRVVSKLLCAKLRVAPLKLTTILRLELNGALLLARLYREVSDALNIIFHRTIFWRDSTIVLHWLNTEPHMLKTYVANRVVEIRELTGSGEWRHIRSEDNPADAVSRGQLPNVFLHNKIWNTGPSWLTKDERDWYQESIKLIKIPELKTNTCLTATHNNFELLGRYSSFPRLCRIVAYCFRFRPTREYNGPLCAKEVNEAENRILGIHRPPDSLMKLRNLKARSRRIKVTLPI